MREEDINIKTIEGQLLFTAIGELMEYRRNETSVQILERLESINNKWPNRWEGK